MIHFHHIPGCHAKQEVVTCSRCIQVEASGGDECGVWATITIRWAAKGGLASGQKPSHAKCHGLKAALEAKSVHGAWREVSGSQRVAFVDLKVACQARGSARSKTLSGLSAPSPVTDKSFIHHESQDREDRNSLLLRWNDSNKLQAQFTSLHCSIQQTWNSHYRR